ncbi:MAG: pyrimidine-nucleoside phosphorylase [Syntrophomonadaceae bacterium]|nr:pyrimidine-nucleoside phosphorylase [Syntrophomonadaceae bacterium]
MNIQRIIEKKRDGLEMSRAEIEYLVKGISDGSIPDYQIAAWAMAVYFQGMNERETAELALAMAYSGEVMDLSPIAGIKVDKHSTGGVGDKTTMVVIPLVAAAGVPVAKMSGRGLSHTGGTIDKFEAIPGFQVERTYQEFMAQVNRVKAAVIAQSGHLVPADKRLYAIRDVTATVESIPLIASSIMSKKIASGAQGIVLDVKVGSGAFMKDRMEAGKLARAMLTIGRSAGREIIVVLTDMNQPLGKMVGNALEVKEAIDTLKGKGPADLEELSLHLAAHMLVLGKNCTSFAIALEKARELLLSGQGLAKFQELVQEQGGRLDYSRADYGLPQANWREKIIAEKTGYISQLDALEVGRAAMALGAGRGKIGDLIDYTVGIKLLKKIGDRVEAGDCLAVIYANGKKSLLNGYKLLKNAFKITDEPVKCGELIIEVL